MGEPDCNHVIVVLPANDAVAESVRDPAKASCYVVFDGNFNKSTSN